MTTKITTTGIVFNDASVQTTAAVIGYTGSRGATGFTGSIGTTGSRGTTGYAGSLGYTGSVGNTGLCWYAASSILAPCP
jgi:hypothetical protein